jgi:hypothetical protein
MAKEEKSNRPKKGMKKPEGLDYTKTKTIHSTQKNLDIDRFRDGVVILKNGGMRVILMVSAINFSLKNQEEQNAIIGGYQSFLNSLSFPLQIVIQSRKLDLTNYLKNLEDRAERQGNELLRTQMASYIDFVQRLIGVANIMDKQFYVVVPYEPAPIKSSSALDKIRKIFVKGSPTQTIKTADFEEAKKELQQRAGLVASGLGALGLRVVQLNTQELTELFYTSYNATSTQFYHTASPEEVMGPMIEKKKKNKGEE